MQRNPAIRAVCSSAMATRPALEISDAARRTTLRQAAFSKLAISPIFRGDLGFFFKQH
jgi:hypothetical protein